MNIEFRTYEEKDIECLKEIWNEIVDDGNAFPGENQLNTKEFEDMISSQSDVTCILTGDKLAGFYILHPNHFGRCGHVANASYCIAKEYRGKKLASHLVKRSIQKAKELGFRGMQFNAVVAGNLAAIHTYEKLGFFIVGTIPGGYRLKDGTYSDMRIMYLPFF